MLENAITAGICSMGVDVLLLGHMPTAAIAFLTTNMRADAGVVISASHNPFQDNGIKIFSGEGFKLPDELEEQIEKLMDSEVLIESQPTGQDVGKAFRIDDAPGRYIVFLKNTFPKDLALDGLKVVSDCAHGATYKVAPAVFEELGAEVIKLGVSPNGTNINRSCGAIYPELMQKAAGEHNADIGIALDGDGDRVIVVDERGSVVDGDHIMAICAYDMIDRGRLNSNTIVATVMSNMGFEVALENKGRRLVRTEVGDRYVVEIMRKTGYNLGGEQSGHLIFLDHITTGDGILAALQLLTVMQRKENPLSKLASIMGSFPPALHNVRVREKKTVDEIAGLKELQDRLEKDLKRRGRILVRPSGTEPVIRMMVEGENEEQIHAIALTMCNHVESVCGV
jgi:phosphoglucosamine mutase